MHVLILSARRESAASPRPMALRCFAALRSRARRTTGRIFCLAMMPYLLYASSAVERERGAYAEYLLRRRRACVCLFCRGGVQFFADAQREPPHVSAPAQPHPQGTHVLKSDACSACWRVADVALQPFSFTKFIRSASSSDFVEHNSANLRRKPCVHLKPIYEKNSKGNIDKK